MATGKGRNNMAYLCICWSVIILLTLVTPAVEGCNEAVCASVVSKCMLTQSCKCDLKNCSCCKECFNCLSYLYSECCSCVDMCPKPNHTSGAESGSNSLGKKSHVEEYGDSMPQLFQALMSEVDTHQRWTTYTFPVDFEVSQYIRPKLSDKEFKLRTQTAEQDVTSAEAKEIMTLNCTVAYMSQCMSWNKCKDSCYSTGASSYRWFHDGCCQCVGNTCINYGLNESKCLDCPISKTKNNFNDDLDSENYAYGDYEDPEDEQMGDLE